jgi:hypothetical protein
MRFVWQHIEFADGSNPYICKTEAEFIRLQKKYCLRQIKCNFWEAKERMHKDLKRAIITWLLDHENEWQRTNACREEFRPYIYTINGNYLIGGKEVAEFISKADKLLFQN